MSVFNVTLTSASQDIWVNLFFGGWGFTATYSCDLCFRQLAEIVFACAESVDLYTNYDMLAKKNKHNYQAYENKIGSQAVTNENIEWPGGVFLFVFVFFLVPTSM